jgi:hypothetical protein
MTRKQHLSLIGLILGIIAGFLAAIDVIGQEARFVHILTLYAAGFGGGASLVVAIRGSKSRTLSE